MSSNEHISLHPSVHLFTNVSGFSAHLLSIVKVFAFCDNNAQAGSLWRVGGARNYTLLRFLIKLAEDFLRINFAVSIAIVFDMFSPCLSQNAGKTEHQDSVFVCCLDIKESSICSTPPNTLVQFEVLFPSSWKHSQTNDQYGWKWESSSWMSWG